MIDHLPAYNHITYTRAGVDKEGSASELDAMRLRCTQLLQPHVEQYIWQHEPLKLHSSMQQQPPWWTAGGQKHKGKMGINTNDSLCEYAFKDVRRSSICGHTNTAAAAAAAVT